MTSHRDKAALVTGGSKGIGLSTAEALAAAGAKVAVLGRKRADPDTAAEKLRSLGAADVLAIQGDVTDIAACERTIAGVIERFGSLDILVNNAGGFHFPGPLATLTHEDMVTTFDLNTFSPLIYALAAYNLHMKENGGVITNMASVSGLQKASGDYGLYGAAKAALIHLTKELAYEFGGGTRVNCVAPGMVPTDLLDLPEEVAQLMQQDYASGRFGHVADVARAVLYLTDPLSSWTHGTVLEVGVHLPRIPASS
jgi:NAD(P)-dependent dehydrogenase (short-subunit alcohol dehydrogenase family)